MCRGAILDLAIQCVIHIESDSPMCTAQHSTTATAHVDRSADWTLDNGHNYVGAGSTLLLWWSLLLNHCSDAARWRWPAQPMDTIAVPTRDWPDSDMRLLLNASCLIVLGLSHAYEPMWHRSATSMRNLFLAYLLHTSITYLN